MGTTKDSGPPLSLDRIITLVGAKVANGDRLSGDVSHVSRLVDLSGSVDGDLAFFFSKHYEGDLKSALPSVLITSDKLLDLVRENNPKIWETSAIVVTGDPYLAMAKLSQAFDRKDRPSKTSVDSSAKVHSSVELGEAVVIGPNVVIGEGTKVGNGSIVHANTVIGQNVTIGCDCEIYPRVTVYDRTQMADRVRVHSGAVLGSDGFGYAPKIENGKPVGHEKIHHLGRVVIGNDVEIGSNTTIDRGTMGDTLIEDKVKIDNQVQIGHNVKLREGAVICGCVGIAGSCEVGSYAYVAGMAGIANKAVVGAYAKVAAQAGIWADVPTGATVSGQPARPHRENLKIAAVLRRLMKKS